MGLIRKSFALGAAMGGVPVVRMNSKKQRVAKAQLNELKKQTAAMTTGSRVTGSDARIADAVARASAESRARSAAARAAAPVAAVLPPEGWYPDPDRDHLLQWWDGANWSGRTAPRA